MVWGVVAVVIGGLYGYFAHGRQDKSALFKAGLLWGAVVAIVFSILGELADASPVGIGLSFVENILSVVITLLLFLLGVWLGDLIEHKTKHRGARRA